jgi:hypothetical protein
MKERDALFEEAEKFVVVPPDEVHEPDRERLTAWCRSQFDRQRGIANRVAEIGKGTAVPKFLERGPDLVFAEWNALLQAGNAKEFGGVEVLGGVGRYEANGFGTVGLGGR